MAVLVVGVCGWATPARASSFVFQWIDNDDSVGLRGVTYRDGTVIQDVIVGEEDYDDGYFLWDDATLASSFNLNFNIFDPDGTLSDTWHLAGNQGDVFFDTPFHSDFEGQPVTPLADAIPLVETGQLQTVFAFLVNNPNGSQSNYTLQFVSDVDSSVIPEPASLLLLGTGLIGAAWRRRQKVRG